LTYYYRTILNGGGGTRWSDGHSPEQPYGQLNTSDTEIRYVVYINYPNTKFYHTKSNEIALIAQNIYATAE